MGGLLLINPRSGGGRPTAAELEEAARAAGIRTHVLTGDDDPAELAGAAEGEPLRIAGGDGSLGAVAAAALERGLPFVCVPVGSREYEADDVAAAADGEPLVLEPPLEFEVVPRVLRVLLPPQAEDLGI